MKHLFLTILTLTNLYASIDDINSFEADFTQTITDEKNKILSYSGHVTASKPRYALWRYIKPVKKDVFINPYEVTIVEEELEQVIIRKLESSLSFFNMIKNAKKINENTYEAYYKESKFTINKKKNQIKSISYIDEFENNVKIVFNNQKTNEDINKNVFIPNYSLDFDIIRD